MVQGLAFRCRLSKSGSDSQYRYETPERNGQYCQPLRWRLRPRGLIADRRGVGNRIGLQSYRRAAAGNTQFLRQRGPLRRLYRGCIVMDHLRRPLAIGRGDLAPPAHRLEIPCPVEVEFLARGGRCADYPDRIRAGIPPHRQPVQPDREAHFLWGKDQ